MPTEYWMLFIVCAAAGLVVGFLAGRSSAPRQRRVEELAHERDAARAEAEHVRQEVSSHFEQSARMFGRLADDYRSFFEHFAQTAQNLGLSEGRARELLRQADPRLIADQAGESGAAGQAGNPPGEEHEVSDQEEAEERSSEADQAPDEADDESTSREPPFDTVEDDFTQLDRAGRESRRQD